MQEKNHAGQEAIDSARDLAVLKLQDMYEVVTRDIMSDTMRYIFCAKSCALWTSCQDSFGAFDISKVCIVLW